MLNKNHTYHLVEVSLWPILGALSTMITLTGVIKWFHLYQMNLFMISVLCTIMVMIQWWRDTSTNMSKKMLIVIALCQPEINHFASVL